MFVRDKLWNYLIDMSDILRTLCNLVQIKSWDNFYLNVIGDAVVELLTTGKCRTRSGRLASKYINLVSRSSSTLISETSQSM